MEGKILVTLLIFLVFLLYVKSTSTYITSDAGADWHSQYQNIGMDIDPTAYDTGAGPGKRYPVTADQDLSQDQINYKMWVNFASIDGTLTAPGGGKPIWGFRKQLQIGGHGTVEYLVTDPTGTGGGTNYQTVKAVAIDTTVFNAVTYVIPNYIIVKRSLISPAITCDSNATPGALDINGQPQGCTCNAGYYGNGSVCNPCLAGYYCPGGANVLACSTSVPVPGASPATTRDYTSALLSTTSSACYMACAVGATSTSATTSSGATCSCQTGNWGTGFACTVCGQGTYSAAGTTGAVGVVTKCPDCAAGTVQPNTGQASCNNCLKNQYSNAPIRTTCTNCAAGTYSLAASADSCTNCTSGYSSLAGQDCMPFATSAALQGYLSSNSPCQGTWNVTTPAGSCPSTCPYAGGTVAGAVYKWSTSIAATGTGTCPQASGSGTSTASPVSCPANNCNCVGGYTVAGPAVACPTTCGYAGSSIAPGVTYTWATTTAATGSGTCTNFGTTSPSTQVCIAIPITSCMPITLTTMGATGSTPPATVTYSPNPLGITLSSGVQVWTVPITRSYTFVVTGASGQGAGPTGGTPNYISGGYGAVVTATISLTQGQTVYCVVGQTLTTYGGSYGVGGGGSFVLIGSISSPSNLIAAGGGGGCVNNCSSGGCAGLTLTPLANYATGGNASVSSCTTKTDGANSNINMAGYAADSRVSARGLTTLAVANFAVGNAGCFGGSGNLGTGGGGGGYCGGNNTTRDAASPYNYIASTGGTSFATPGCSSISYATASSFGQGTIVIS
jgi:hypothetical protein